ncbi:hypothetical protein BJX99DRAFT_261677 [Aspergillus californicus]
MSRRTSAIEISSSSPPRPLRSSTTQAGPSGTRKRRRLTNQTDSPDEPIEAIDLTDVEGKSVIDKVLAKQREDAIAAQKSGDGNSAPSTLAAYKCPICMCAVVDATTTVCGHIYCHMCIMNWLKKFDDQRPDHTGKSPRGFCPNCRKLLTRSDAPGPRRNLIPLQFKLTTRKEVRSTSVDGS